MNLGSASEKLQIGELYSRESLAKQFLITDATLKNGVFRPKACFFRLALRHKEQTCESNTICARLKILPRISCIRVILERSEESRIFLLPLALSGRASKVRVLAQHRQFFARDSRFRCCSSIERTAQPKHDSPCLSPSRAD